MASLGVNYKSSDVGFCLSLFTMTVFAQQMQSKAGDTGSKGPRASLKSWACSSAEPGAIFPEQFS